MHLLHFKGRHQHGIEAIDKNDDVFHLKISDLAHETDIPDLKQSSDV